MRRNPIETIMGAVVLLVAGFFLAFAYSTSSVKPVQGYNVKATFARVGGLETGSDVRISGIKIGTVVGQSLDPNTYEAVVRLSIAPHVRLPTDTVASIVSEGLLGGKYLKLEPGNAAERIPDGGAVAQTRDFKSLEETVSEIIFLATQGADEAK
ncbi:MAG: outer membrane lipid asymmetry maintenance protein MlaD [Alphaproteobacteria bacterium]|nr:outer membrane lipid asymmetry maintenance protein MlaD [Alphaproteobacteria bacterium]